MNAKESIARNHVRVLSTLLILVAGLTLPCTVSAANKSKGKGKGIVLSRPGKTLVVLKTDSLRVPDEASFFSALDLNRPGMEKVKKAAAGRDWPAAKKALLDYMKNRKKPRFFLDRWKKDEFTAFVRSELADAIPQSIAVADVVCKREFNWAYLHRFKGPVIWDRQKSGVPFSFGCMLNRMIYLNKLGVAWWLTDDRKYARCAYGLVDEFLKSCPMPPEARRHWMDRKPPTNVCVTGNSWGQLLEVAERMGNWVAFNEYFIDSGEFTPEFYYRFLSAMLEHARFVYAIEYYGGYNGGNWGLVECSNLSRVAIMFPEFKESTDWLKLTNKYLAKYVRKSVLPDGAWHERCLSYHNWCLLQFRQAFVLFRANNAEQPKGFAETLKNMDRYVKNIAYPQAGAPAIGDVGRVAWWSAKKKVPAAKAKKQKKNKKTLRPLWQVGLDAYRQKKKYRAAVPGYTSTEFPHTGFFIMRTGWQPKDKYLLFDCVPRRSNKATNTIGAGTGCSHWHNSSLNVDIYAYGRPLIVDPGTGSYEHHGYLDYFRKVRAHNIIEFAGEENDAEPKLKRWLRSPGFDLAEGSISAKRALRASMNRRVLFVTGDYWIIDDIVNSAHNRFAIPARAYWHLNSRSVVVGGKQVELSPTGDGPRRIYWKAEKGKDLSFHTNDPDTGNILVIPDGAEKYVSLAMIADTPCGGHVACYRQDPIPIKKEKLYFTTLLYPFQGTKRPAASFKDGVVRIGDDRVDNYIRKGEQTDGDCALLSRRNGKLERVLLVAGSSVKNVVLVDGKVDFLILTRRDNVLDVQIIGAKKVKRLELPGFTGIKQVTVNGKTCPLSRDKGIDVVAGPFKKIKPNPKNAKLFWITNSTTAGRLKR